MAVAEEKKAEEKKEEKEKLAFTVSRRGAGQPGFEVHKVSDGSDFELEFYKLHRAHEVALNNATGAYEHSLLRLILVLNSAAIGVTLTLIQASGGGTARIDFNFGQARLAIASWATGVAFAFAASFLGYLSQRDYTMAYRDRRRAIEARRAKGVTTLETFGVPGRTRRGDRDVPDGLRKSANRQRDAAVALQQLATASGAGAIIAAVLGFALVVGSVKEIPLPARSPAGLQSQSGSATAATAATEQAPMQPSR